MLFVGCSFGVTDEGQDSPPVWGIQSCSRCAYSDTSGAFVLPGCGAAAARRAEAKVSGHCIVCGGFGMKIEVMSAFYTGAGGCELSAGGGKGKSVVEGRRDAG